MDPNNDLIEFRLHAPGGGPPLWNEGVVYGVPPVQAAELTEHIVAMITDWKFDDALKILAPRTDLDYAGIAAALATGLRELYTHTVGYMRRTVVDGVVQMTPEQPTERMTQSFVCTEAAKLDYESPGGALLRIHFTIDHWLRPYLDDVGVCYPFATPEQRRLMAAAYLGCPRREACSALELAQLAYDALGADERAAAPPLPANHLEPTDPAVVWYIINIDHAGLVAMLTILAESTAVIANVALYAALQAHYDSLYDFRPWYLARSMLCVKGEIAVANLQIYTSAFIEPRVPDLVTWSLRILNAAGMDVAEFDEVLGMRPEDLVACRRAVVLSRLGQTPITAAKIRDAQPYAASLTALPKALASAPAAIWSSVVAFVLAAPRAVPIPPSIVTRALAAGDRQSRRIVERASGENDDDPNDEPALE